MKNILVPTDFSTCARSAEKIGLELAKRTNAQLQFLHLEKTPAHLFQIKEEWGEMVPEISEQISESESELERLVTEAEKAGVQAWKFTGFEDIFEGIMNHIQRSNVDFVVMGSHGASGFKELFLGSNTQKIARSVNCPVLVVKENHEKLPLGDIAFAFTFDQEALEPFRKIVDFAKTLSVKIHVFYINTPFNFLDSTEINTRMGNFALHYPGIIASTNIYNYHDLDEGLMKFCRTKGVHLLSMITHGRSGLARLLSRSITESIINHAQLPVLSLNIGH